MLCECRLYRLARPYRCATLNQLIENLRKLFYKWLECEDLVLLPVRSVSYQAPLLQHSKLTGPGRPSFYISKDQLVYLSSNETRAGGLVYGWIGPPIQL